MVWHGFPARWAGLRDVAPLALRTGGMAAPSALKKDGGVTGRVTGRRAGGAEDRRGLRRVDRGWNFAKARIRRTSLPQAQRAGHSSAQPNGLGIRPKQIIAG